MEITQTPGNDFLEVLQIGVWRHCSKSRPTSIGIGSAGEVSGTIVIPSEAVCARVRMDRSQPSLEHRGGEDSPCGMGGIRRGGSRGGSLSWRIGMPANLPADPSDSQFLTSRGYMYIELESSKLS